MTAVGYIVSFFFLIHFQIVYLQFIEIQLVYFYFLFYFLFKFILFIHFSLRWIFVAVSRLSVVAVSGGYSSLWCAGFSLRWLLLLWSTVSRCVGFSSCSARAQ